MNTILRILSFVASILAVIGCANNRDKTVLVKSTVLGIRVDPYQGGPGFRMGLVRDQYLAAPIGAHVKTHVDATVGAMTQKAIEDVEISSAPIVRLNQTNAPSGPPALTNKPSVARLTNILVVKAQTNSVQ